MRDYLTCTETAKLVRQALKESFPSVKFSVRSSSYSGGASIDVYWTDGPTAKQVKKICEVFSRSYFDGMIDYKGSIYHSLDGKPVRLGADFVSEHRHASDELIARGIAAVSKAYGGCEPITVDDYRQGRSWTWRNSGGCDMHRALNLWLSGERELACVELDPPFPMLESPTVARIKMTGSDEYGAPFGSRGYPKQQRSAS